MKISWKWNKKKILYLRSLQGNSIIGVTKGKLTKSPQRGLKFRQEQMILFDLLTTGLNVFPEEEKLEIAIRSPRYCIQSCIQINTGVKLVFLECSHSRMRVQWLSLGKISRLKKKKNHLRYWLWICRFKLLITFRLLWSRFSAQENRKVFPDHIPNRADLCTSCFVVDWGMSKASSQSALNGT